jgi:hypothetical protein
MKMLVCLFFALALVACAAPTPSVDQIGTAIAQTQAAQAAIEAGLTQTQMAIVPTSTEPPLPTFTPKPTFTRWPTNTPRPTNTPKPPTSTPEPITLTGNGDAIVDFELATRQFPSGEEERNRE